MKFVFMSYGWILLFISVEELEQYLIGELKSICDQICATKNDDLIIHISYMTLANFTDMPQVYNICHENISLKPN